MNKRMLSLMLVLILCFLTACGSGVPAYSASVPSEAPETTKAPETVAPVEETAVPADSARETADSALEETAATAEAPAELVRQVELPLCDETETISMWLRSNFMNSDPIQSYMDSPVLQKAQELTNVEIEFVEVSNASESETFNLMIAGGDYTDIIYNFAKLYTGGIDSALDNDIIVDLNDYMDATPCYASILASDEDVRKAATTDSGVIGAFYSIYESTPYLTDGLTIRGDWLEELGLESPKTYKDYENVLLAFKDTYDPEYPLYLPSCGTLDAITRGYEFSYSVAGDNVTLFAQKDGQVFFSATSDQFREYLTMMHSWYDQGLISKDFVTNGDWMFMNGEYQSMLTTGDAGIVALGAGLYSEFTGTGQDLDENYRLEGILNPRLDPDDAVGSTPGSRASDAIYSVTASSDKVELACQWCDFWYTEEGSMLANYGIEGESYVVGADGNPEYTDLILNNETYSDRSMKNLYSFNTSNLMDPEKDLSGITEDGLASIELWSSDPPSETFSTVNMTLLSLTTDESTQYGIICADAQTYCLENVLQFINGSLSVESDWDNYVSVLNDMGVEEAVAIVQTAYDRYQAR